MGTIPHFLGAPTRTLLLRGFGYVSQLKSWLCACTLHLRKTTLMLHTITSTHVNRFWQFWAEMLPREHTIKWRFAIPPLLTNVSALSGNMNPGNYVFSVMLYTVSRKRHWFGLLYIRHASTNFHNLLQTIRSYYYVQCANIIYHLAFAQSQKLANVS